MTLPCPMASHCDGDWQRHAPFLDRLAIGLLLHDAHGRVLEANQQAIELLGINALEGRPLDDGVWSFHDDANASLTVPQHPVARVLASGKAVVGEILAFTRPDGGERWLDLTAEPISGPDGSLQVALALIDITAREAHFAGLLREKTEQIEAINTHDNLSGVLNRREVLRLLDEEIERNRRYGSRFTLALLDIDGLRRINALQGLDAGDQSIVQVAGALQQTLRDTDHIGRYSGGTFMLILPGVGIFEAIQGLERVRARLAAAAAAFALAAPEISIGVVEYAGETASRVIAEADELLQQAKHDGGNRTVYEAPL